MLKLLPYNTLEPSRKRITPFSGLGNQLESHGPVQVLLSETDTSAASENTQRLLELCCRQNVCITNTMFPGKPHRKQTWCHPQSKSWHQLDFAVVKQRHKQEVRNTRTNYHSADCDTDHSLVCFTMSLQPEHFHRQKRQFGKIYIHNTAIPVLN